MQNAECRMQNDAFGIPHEEENSMKLIDKIHNLSLQGLTLSGFAALVCLTVNIITALTMFVAERCRKAQ